MNKLLSLIAILFCAFQLTAQVDFSKLAQEYVSRKPGLDSMYAYPDVPYRSIKLINSQGIWISSWWIPKETNKGTILLVHGFAMNKSMMLGRAKLYYNLGYNVLLMDLRARGESGGQSTTSGPEIRSDVMALIDYYTDSLRDYGPLVLAGYSHGGRAVVFAAEERTQKVKAIILESIPYSLSEGFKRIYKVNPPPFPEGNLAGAFQAISELPILLMVGEKDNAIIPEEAQRIKELFKNQESRMILFEGAGHDLSNEKHRSLYQQSIEAFLKAVLLIR